MELIVSASKPPIRNEKIRHIQVCVKKFDLSVSSCPNVNANRIVLSPDRLSLLKRLKDAWVATKDHNTILA
jgi:hypothetical protein